MRRFKSISFYQNRPKMKKITKFSSALGSRSSKQSPIAHFWLRAGTEETNCNAFKHTKQQGQTQLFFALVSLK